jgi:serine/threonine-protein kinase
LMHGPQTLPGGKALLFTVADNFGLPGPARWDQAKIVVQFLQSGERKTLIEGGSDARYVPTGHLVYMLHGSLFAVPFDVDRVEVTGPSVRLVEGVRITSTSANSNTGTGQFSFSEGGTLVYIPEALDNNQRQLALVDLNGKIKPLAVPQAPYLYPRISPDGQQVSVATDDTRESITWVGPLSGATPLRRLTFAGGRNDNAVWSGDGQWLIMRSNREGGAAGINLFRQRADGTGTAERVTEALKAEVVTSQSPGSGYWSGPNQIFTQTRGAEYNLWTFSSKDKKATPFHPTPGSEQINGGFSPDGRWVAYSSNEIGRFEIYVRPFSGDGKFQITHDGGAHPQWAANGRELYFDNKGTVYHVPIQFMPTVTWGSPVALPITGFYQPDGRPRHYDLSPDGKYFVMIFTGEALTKTTEPSQIQYVLNWFEELKHTTSR